MAFGHSVHHIQLQSWKIFDDDNDDADAYDNDDDDGNDDDDDDDGWSCVKKFHT